MGGRADGRTGGEWLAGWSTDGCVGEWMDTWVYGCVLSQATNVTIKLCPTDVVYKEVMCHAVSCTTLCIESRGRALPAACLRRSQHSSSF